MVLSLELLRSHVMGTNSLESVDGWLQWIHDCICVVENAWSSADLQLQLSVYLLTGVVVLWSLIGIAWWIYGEAISNLFELKNGSVSTDLSSLPSSSNLASSSSEFIAPWQDHSFHLSPETQKLTQRIRHLQT